MTYFDNIEPKKGVIHINKDRCKGCEFYVEYCPKDVLEISDKFNIIGNLVMLGVFTAVTKIVSPEAMKKALPGLVPDRFLELNIKGFDKGYEHGLKVLKKIK